MREIKFRAWHDIDKKWLHGYEMHNEGCSIYGEIIITGNWLNEMHGLLDINNIIVEQYTGLKDKKGQDIYEGDILGFLNNEGYTVKSSIVWDYGVFWFGNDWILGVDVQQLPIEVVGNIHENPELLEAEDVGNKV
jgi:uncharacterized phage protein (TIGR01671 family)